MKRFFLATSLPLAVFLSACSPQAYQVNPNPNAVSESGGVPESQQEGYMRIIGDLRWDKLTSPKDWQVRFPGCFNNDLDRKYNALYPIGLGSSVGPIDYFKSPNPKCEFVVGGLRFLIIRVVFEKDPSGSRPLRLQFLGLYMPRDDQERAFSAAIKQKYSQTDSGICSKYTCISGGPRVYFNPTPYVTSVLDAVKVDPSKF